jgi:signal peptidase I
MGKLLRALAWTVAILAVIGGVARLTLVDVWKIPEDPHRFGITMEPSLSQGDTILMLSRGSPGFGDLVRCTDPDDPEGFVVGRVAGLEGDTVQVNGRELIVDNKRYEGEMACPEKNKLVVHPTSGEEVKLNCDQVEMGGRTHYRGYSAKRDFETPKKSTVGHGMVFLVSDDRSYHADSRDFGPIPFASCKNRIFFRLWGASGWADDKARLSYIR